MYKATLATSDHPNDKYRSQAQSLQEAFPTWSNDDLQSLLVEVGGDVELAATRIYEGHAEQWGSVNRKKDKKTSALPSPQSQPSTPRGRGGARGGRGRGGHPTRGARGPTRGHHRNHSASNSNGRASPAQNPSFSSEKHAHIDAFASDWTTDSNPPTDQQDPAAVANPLVASTSSVSTWDSNPPDPNSSSVWGVSSVSTAAWGTDSAASDSLASNGNASAASTPSVPVHTIKPATPALAQKTAKVPPGAKLSWAQIARPQEKHAPPLTTPSPLATVSVPTTPSQQPQPLVQEPQPHVLPEPSANMGWEDPTTVQAPTWDDEPSIPGVGVGASRSSTLTAEGWEEISPEDAALSVDGSKDGEHDSPERKAAAAAVTSSSSVQEATSQSQQTQQQQHAAPQLEDARKATVTPTRAAGGVGAAARRYKTDQPVVMPSGFGLEKIGMQFGSLSLGGESLFDGDSPAPEPSAPESTSQQSQQAAPSQQQQPPNEVVAPMSPSASAALGGGAAYHGQAIPAQVQAQAQAAASPIPAHQSAQSHAQVQSPAQQQQQQQHAALTPSASQSSVTTSSSGQAQMQGFAQQAQMHAQQQQLHQYAQHGLPTHIDPAQTQAQQVQAQSQQPLQHSPQQPHAPPQQQQQHHAAQQAQQQQQPTHAPGSYIRQDPYFHTPTPPQAGQDFGVFGPGALGQGVVGLGSQHQGVSVGSAAPHLDYGAYADGQRGFYDSYGQQGAFGNRSVLGHDDVKGLPGTQQPSATTGLAPAASQSSQQHPSGTQAAGQPGPSSGQGPQQYPPPVPYYFPYPQNQYYGSPYNSGYGVPQPFVNVKYPAMFQGPPGPGSAPTPTAKQGQGNVQPPPPSNPYGQSLYAAQQHPSAASYDEIGYQHHHTQHGQHQSVSASLPAAAGEYGKQLYGAHAAAAAAAAAGGMQGFMATLGQGAGGGPAGAGGPQRGAGGTSPDTPYKPYGTNMGVGVGVKDVSGAGGVGQGGVGMGGPGGQGGPQGRGGLQQHQQHQQQGQQGQQQQQQPHAPGAFYANRFAANAGAGAPQGGVSSHQHQHHQSQSQGPAAHLGYGQAAGDATFYSYQRGQQGYWQ